MEELKFSKKHIAEFKKMGILAVYLYGSRAVGRNIHPLSDFDFAVIFENPQEFEDATKRNETYLKLYEIFSGVLPKDYLRKRFELREHEFDLVFPQFASVNIRFETARRGKVLYEKNRRKRLDYEEDIIKRYCDLKYYHDIRYKAILERIK